LAQNTSNKRRAATIHPPVRLVGEPKKTKKRKEGRKALKTVANWVFAQTTHVVKSKSNFAWWVACDVQLYISSVIKSVKGLWRCGGVENGPSLLLWPVAHSTTCTTVQAVISEHLIFS